MKNPEIYSHGNSATVLRTTPQERLQFPGADLVRIQFSYNPRLAQELFVKMLIAHKIFPDNFPTPAGFQTSSQSQDIQNLPDVLKIQYEKTLRRRPFLSALKSPYMHMNYSQIANVPSDHAVFTMHFKEQIRETITHMGCPECGEHSSIHEANLLDYEEALSDLQSKSSLYGIYVIPGGGDPTDYCSGPNGLVVFEVEEFNRIQCGRILRTPGTTPAGESHSESLIAVNETLRRFNAHLL